MIHIFLYGFAEEWYLHNQQEKAGYSMKVYCMYFDKNYKTSTEIVLVSEGSCITDLFLH